MKNEFPLAQVDGNAALKICLANTPLYHMFNDRQLDGIVAASLPLRAMRGSHSVTQGDAPKGIYTVAHGRVKLHFLRKDGAEKTLNILGQNDCFGLAETMLNKPHLTFATPVSDAVIVLTPKEKVLELAKESFLFAQTLMACTARQSRAYLHELESKTYESATQRLADYLLQQCVDQSADSVRLDISKTLIASRLGMAAPTLSRLLHWFSSQNLIEVQGRHIRILNRRKMATLLSAPAS